MKQEDKMSKYTPPAVTFLDVAAALPALPMPLSLRCSVVPTRNTTSRVYAAVELVYYGGKGEAFVYRRWGRDVSAKDTAQVLKVLLLAAQEAYVYLDGKDSAELTRFIEWQLGIPRYLA